MQMIGLWGRYLPQWLRAPGNGSGPAICQHAHTHTGPYPHTGPPTTMSVLETPFDIHVSSVYQTHTCMQAPVSTLCISAKETHNKGSQTLIHGKECYIIIVIYLPNQHMCLRYNYTTTFRNNWQRASNLLIHAFQLMHGSGGLHSH